MALTIQTNVASLVGQQNVAANQRNLLNSFARLSSGYRVNSSSDDAAGLAISESMKSQIRSYTVAQRNAADGMSMAQTAEGALSQVHDVLGRMRELAMQASNGDLQSSDRDYISTEFVSLQSEITRIQDSTKFNNQDLVKAADNQVTFQVGLGGSYTTSTENITVSFGNVDLATIVSAGTTVAGATNTGAHSALSAIDTAIGNVSTARSRFGTAVNRLQYATNTIQTMTTNLSAANSRIVDVDVASESAAMARSQVLTQAGVSVLAQANALPQMAFGLIGH
jgi:flagellin